MTSCIIVDGNDIEAVYQVVQAVERVRQGEGPSLIEANLPMVGAFKK